MNAVPTHTEWEKEYNVSDLNKNRERGHDHEDEPQNGVSEQSDYQKFKEWKRRNEKRKAKLKTLWAKFAESVLLGAVKVATEKAKIIAGRVVAMAAALFLTVPTLTTESPKCEYGRLWSESSQQCEISTQGGDPNRPTGRDPDGFPALVPVPEVLKLEHHRITNTPGSIATSIKLEGKVASYLRVVSFSILTTEGDVINADMYADSEIIQAHNSQLMSEYLNGVDLQDDRQTLSIELPENVQTVELSLIYTTADGA